MQACYTDSVPCHLGPTRTLRSMLERGFIGEWGPAIILHPMAALQLTAVLGVPSTGNRSGLAGRLAYVTFRCPALPSGPAAAIKLDHFDLITGRPRPWVAPMCPTCSRTRGGSSLVCCRCNGTDRLD